MTTLCQGVEGAASPQRCLSQISIQPMVHLKQGKGTAGCYSWVSPCLGELEDFPTSVLA